MRRADCCFLGEVIELLFSRPETRSGANCDSRSGQWWDECRNTETSAWSIHRSAKLDLFLLIYSAGLQQVCGFFHSEQIGLNLLLCRGLLLRSRRVTIGRVVDPGMVEERRAPKWIEVATMFIAASVPLAAHSGGVAAGSTMCQGRRNKREKYDSKTDGKGQG